MVKLIKDKPKFMGNGLFEIVKFDIGTVWAATLSVVFIFSLFMDLIISKNKP